MDITKYELNDFADICELFALLIERGILKSKDPEKDKKKLNHISDSIYNEEYDVFKGGDPNS